VSSDGEEDRNWVFEGRAYGFDLSAVPGRTEELVRTKVDIIIVMFSYATNIREHFRRGATYIDKILKGAKPGDFLSSNRPSSNS
jgi:hypothetical protein